MGPLTIAGAAGAALAMGVLATWPAGSPDVAGWQAAEPRERLARVHEVEVQGFAFVPATVTVSVGDTVVWINRDALPHTATAVDSTWTSPRLRTDERWGWVVTGEGPREYLCAYHPTMRGVIDVQP